MWRAVPGERELLITYWDRVRQTIAGLDTLVVDVLTRGATLVIAILVAPWAIVRWTGSSFLGAGAPHNLVPSGFYMGAFMVSIVAVAAATYVIFAVSLYADLLKRSVALGIELEKTLMDAPEKFGLTTVLDGNRLAAGQLGRALYLTFAVLLYFAVSLASAYYFRLAHYACWCVALLFIFYMAWGAAVILTVRCFWTEHSTDTAR